MVRADQFGIAMDVCHPGEDEQAGRDVPGYGDAVEIEAQLPMERDALRGRVELPADL